MSEHSVADDTFVVFGAALVLTMLLRPGGLIPNARRRAEMLPDDDEDLVAESQSLHDVRHDGEPALGERA